MNNYLRIDISTNSTEEQEIIIAELSEKFEAFGQEENLLSAFIKEEDFDELLMKNITCNYAKSIIPKTNWNKKWESEFEPVRIDDFVTIRAAFHSPLKEVKHEIIITPKMSFGTGHHATTYLMLQEMKRINFSNKKVLDFGTGTGILSIMASKLGAKKITAIDNDEWSIENAKENFQLNNCNNIDVFKKDDLEDLETFDIILANINLAVILSNLIKLKKVTSKSSIILFSGFLKVDEKKFLEKTYLAGLNFQSCEEKENWICVKVIS